MSRNDVIDDTTFTLVASASLSVKFDLDLVRVMVAVVDCSVSSNYLRSPEPNLPLDSF